MKKKSIPNNQKGAIAVIFALLLIVLIGFAALGIDAGRWYAVKSKACEACDAAVLAGVQAYGSANWKTLAEDVARENFHQGYLGYQLIRNDIAGVSVSGEPRVTATICATGETFFARIFGIDTAEVCCSCAAGRVPLEIILVLDRSSSLDGQTLTHLKTAAQSFVDHFEATQDVDRMGLITFATGVKVVFPLQNYFIDDGIKTKIEEVAVESSGTFYYGDVGNPGSCQLGDVDTNMEDALDQADDDTKRDGSPTTTFTDQSGIPENQRVKQFLVFFTDGNACSFRATFTRNGVEHDAVIPAPDNPCNWGGPPGDSAYAHWRQGIDVCPLPLDENGKPIIEVYNKGMLQDPYTGLSINIYFMPTGDGLPVNQTGCKCDCVVQGDPADDKGYENTKWPMFDPLWNDEYNEWEDDYCIDGICKPANCPPGGVPSCCSSPYCDIDEYAGLRDYVIYTAEKMTKYHARKLKEQGIIIYTLGYGYVNDVFLEEIATAKENYYKVPTSNDLTSLFNKIATETKKYVHLVE